MAAEVRVGPVIWSAKVSIGGTDRSNQQDVVFSRELGRAEFGGHRDTVVVTESYSRVPQTSSYEAGLWL